MSQIEADVKQEHGLSERTRALITGYSVGAPPRAGEQAGLSEEMRALLGCYVDAFRACGLSHE